MAHFRTIRGKQAAILNRNELLFIHGVSKELLNLILEGLPCVELECREVHVSFVDSLDVRRIALIPSVVNGIKVDEILQ